MSIVKQIRRTLICLIGCVSLCALAVGPSYGQEVVDKTVATVSDGARTQLITYSDILWQLALQPGVPIDPPRREDLARGLESLINQRIFALEAGRLPRSTPSDKEVAAEVTRILTFFPSTAAFESRLRQVGFSTIRDDAFEKLIAQRLATEKYIDFRFGSFVVITADEEAGYYRGVFTPEFRQASPGLLMPTLDEKRAEIRQILTRQKIGTAIERFLDEAKRRVVIEILIPI